MYMCEFDLTARWPNTALPFVYNGVIEMRQDFRRLLAREGRAGGIFYDAGAYEKQIIFCIRK